MMATLPKDDLPNLYAVVRVPKTGSTSLAGMFYAALPDAKFHNLHFLGNEDKQTGDFYSSFRHHRRQKRFLRKIGVADEQALFAKIQAEAVEGDVLIGHFPMSKVQYPLERLQPITMLRDPVARFLSRYRYDRVGYQKRNWIRRSYVGGQLAAAGTRDLDSYIDFAEAHRDLFRNDMARQLSTSGDPQKALDEVRQHYFHIGTLEQIDRFAVELQEKLARPVQVERKNVTPSDGAVVSPQQRSRIESLVDLDMQLYTLAAQGG